MKKILYFASALLTLGMMSSCVKYDNPIDEKIIIVDENGNKYETGLIATLTGQVGSEVSLTLGVYDLFDIYGVDFGDGVIKVDTVGNENGGVKDESGQTKPGTIHTGATKFTGTIAGDGVIKVYGNSDVWYFISEGGAMPTSLDQEKLKNVVQMTISGANVDNVVVPYTEVLKTFNFRNSPAKNVDVSQAPNLTSFSVENMTNSPYDNNITGVDVSKNTKLEYLYVSVSSSDKEGHVESVDLSNNPAIKNVYVSGVHLKNIILPEGGEITTINLSDNELSALDFSKVKSIKSLLINGNKFETLSLAGLAESSMSTLTANNNQLTTIDFAGVLAEKVALSVNDNLLTELDVPVVTNNLNAQNNKLKKFTYKGLSSSTRYLRLQDNELTLATLPVKPEKTTNYTKYFIYAPQADMEVAPNGAVLDLSAQASAQGVLEAAVATKFEFAAGETALKAGEDYKETAAGVFEFLKSFQGVVCTMTTDAFPGLTLKTKPFDVTVGEAATAIFTANPVEAWDAPAGAETEITSAYATIAGGKIFAINQQESAKAMIKKQGGEFAFQCTNNNTFFKIVLDKALQAGDIISIRMQSRTDTDLGLFFAATDSRPSETTTSIILPTAEAQAWVDAPTYTVKADDGICGQSTFYAFRATGKSTYFNTFTITRGK